VCVYEGKVFPITGRGGPQGCDTLRLSHFLDNRFTDGDDDIGLTRQGFLSQGRFLVLILLKAESTPGL
jgi:hypothetical protein